MTDLERAREILARYPLETAQHVIAEALAAARREGEEAERVSTYVWALRAAEEMRERAARLADGYCTDRTDDVARGIRALPLTPEER